MWWRIKPEILVNFGGICSSAQTTADHCKFSTVQIPFAGAGAATGGRLNDSPLYIVASTHSERYAEAVGALRATTFRSVIHRF
jgi:hypothetical protein